MEAYILGCGGMMPLPHRHLTSVLVTRDGEHVLFDCGEGTQVSLRSLNLSWKKISIILISHTHADHITGLPGLLMLSAQVARTEPLYIIGPPRVAEYVHYSRKVLEMYIDYKIIVQEIRNPEQPQVVYEGEEYEIRSFPLDHTRVCVGYALIEHPRPGRFFPEKAERLKVPRGPRWSELQNGKSVLNSEQQQVMPEQVLGAPRHGRKFSFVTDTLASMELAPHLAGSDLLVCEGMFDRSLQEISYQKKHMTAFDAGMLAKLAGDVQKLVLVHFSPRYTNRELLLLQEEAQENFAAAVAGRDRQVIPIPFRDKE